MGWLAEKRERHRLARRQAAVQRHSGVNEPREVSHALDFFFWSALDDREFLPQGGREFSDEERYYNEILNQYLNIDGASTAPATHMRLPPKEGARYVPCYFPDDFHDVIGAVAKDFHVVSRFAHRLETLEQVARFGVEVGALQATGPRDVLMNVEAYRSFYPDLQDAGLRFAGATAEMREQITIDAPCAAVIPPNVVPDPSSFAEAGWRRVAYHLAHEVIQDFLDPEALL